MPATSGKQGIAAVGGDQHQRWDFFNGIEIGGGFLGGPDSPLLWLLVEPTTNSTGELRSEENPKEPNP